MTPARSSTFSALSRSLLLALACLCPSLVTASLEPLADAVVTDFELSDLGDRRHRLADYRGKVVLVNFWASWCPPCIHEMPELKQLKRALADRPFEILAVNAGEKKYKVRKFVKLISLDLPVLLDSNNHTFNAWDVKTLPTSFLVDAEGKLRYRVQGNPGWNHAHTMQLIETLLGEQSTHNGRRSQSPSAGLNPVQTDADAAIDQ